MKTTVQKKIKRLRHLISAYESVAIGFSGGVDSTFLCAIAAEELNNILAVTIATSFQKPEDIKQAQEIASQLSISHIVKKVPIEHEQFYTENPKNRCYSCKYFIFSIIQNIAETHQISRVFEGTTSDDITYERPGMKALKDLGICSPLLEVNLTKKEIRQISKAMNLPTWNKPSESCLATRIPNGERITPKKLKSINDAEQMIKQYGLSIVRVRHHDTIAVIEVPKKDIPLIYHHEEQISKSLKSLGFINIYLNLNGYQPGKTYEGITQNNLRILSTRENNA